MRADLMPAWDCMFENVSKFGKGTMSNAHAVFQDEVKFRSCATVVPCLCSLFNNDHRHMVGMKSHEFQSWELINLNNDQV